MFVLALEASLFAFQQNMPQLEALSQLPPTMSTRQPGPAKSASRKPVLSLSVSQGACAPPAPPTGLNFKEAGTDARAGIGSIVGREPAEQATVGSVIPATPDKEHAPARIVIINVRHIRCFAARRRRRSL